MSRIKWDEIYPMTPIERLKTLREETYQLLDLSGLLIDASEPTEELVKISDDIRAIMDYIDSQIKKDEQ